MTTLANCFWTASALARAAAPRWKIRLLLMHELACELGHAGTLRQARYGRRGFGGTRPVDAARICVAAGAYGITAHLREDRRHIQDRDVWELREAIETRLNLEMP